MKRKLSRPTSSPPARTGAQRPGEGRWPYKSARYGVLWLYAAWSLLPLVFIGFWSLKSEQQIREQPLSPPIRPVWENFAEAWTTGRFSTYVPNTVIYGISITLGVVILSTLAGYALARLSFPGRNALFMFFLAGIIVPFFSVMIPVFFFVQRLGLTGTRLGLIVPGTALALPFGIFLMRAFFRGLPEELADAARVDGASEWQVFRLVMLPLARSGVVTLSIFQFLFTWNMFLEPLVLVQRDALRPVATGLLFFETRFTIDRGLMSAGIIITIVPMIIVYLFLRRRFVEGLTAGAVKG